MIKTGTDEERSRDGRVGSHQEKGTYTDDKTHQVKHKASINPWARAACLRQHAATHCITLQHTATRCNTLQHAATRCNTLQHASTRCNTLQHTATHRNTLQHTTTHCHTLPHTDHTYKPTHAFSTHCAGNTSGLPTDFLKLKRLSTLWIEGNPIEFPPPPIPDLSFKHLIAWLRQSHEACDGENDKVQEKPAASFERLHSSATSISSSRDLTRSASDAQSARGMSLCSCVYAIVCMHIYARVTYTCKYVHVQICIYTHSVVFLSFCGVLMYSIFYMFVHCCDISVAHVNVWLQRQKATGSAMNCGTSLPHDI